ncbi:MAG TPA: hypothetical protein VEG30_00770 [Terriglobales bacterium]|nr:hypothetical protein [Terriglobales bacterium]
MPAPVRTLSRLACVFLAFLCFAWPWHPIAAQVAVAQQTEILENKEDPKEREDWFLRGRMVNGRPASRELQRAHQQKLSNRQLRQSASQALKAQASTSASSKAISSVAQTNAATGGQWKPLGPAPLHSVPPGAANPEQDYGFVVGRATAVAVDQTDPTGNTLYLGGAYGGLWKSTSAASPDVSKVAWQQLLDNQPTLAVGSVAVQPGNGNVILVGTGEANSSADSYYGLGILRSENGGTTWTLITQTADGKYSFHGLAFAKIAFNSENPLVVVAAAAGSAVGIKTGAESSDQNRGLYYSTDSGKTWSRANVSDGGGSVTSAGSVTSVIYHSARHLFYAAVRYHGFYTSPDAINWTRLPDAQQPAALTLANCPTVLPPAGQRNCPIYRGEMAQVPGRDETYVWVVDALPSNQGIWQLSSGANTWTQINTSGIDNCGDTAGCSTQQGDYNLALAAVPNGTATDLYAAAINIFKCSINSVNATCGANGFINLTHVYGCTPTASYSHVHPDQHAIDFSLSNPAILYFGNDGGIYRTLNGFATGVTGVCGSTPTYPFDNLNGTMGSMTQFVWFSQDPTDQFTILGGTQDNGSPAINFAHSGSNGLTWQAVNDGDGGYNDIDPHAPSTWYTANIRLPIQRCTNGINCTADSFLAVVTPANISNDAVPFYTPYMLDPQNSAQMILGSCRVWCGGATGQNWHALSNKFDGSAGTTACASDTSSFVNALAAGGSTTGNGSQVVYAGTDDGRIFATLNADAGPTSWSEISPVSGGFHAPNCSTGAGTCPVPVSGVAIDPSDASGKTAYLTVQGFGVGHVWRTSNGSNWTDISGSGSSALPDAPANAVVVDSKGIVYVGTDVGVFTNGPAGGSSSVWTEVGPASGPGMLPNVAVTRVAIFSPSGQPPLLRVSTYGRGVWQTELPSSTAPNFSVAVSNPDQVTYPGQNVSYTGTLTSINGYSNSVTVSCESATGDPLPSCSSPITVTPTAGGQPFSLTSSNATVGDFFFRIKATDGTLVDFQPVSLRVWDFTLGAPNPATVVLSAGKSQQVTLILTPQGSFSQNINLSCQGLPSGASCNASNVLLTPSPLNATLTISLAPGSTLAPGDYSIIVVATTGDSKLSRSQPLKLTVTPATPDFFFSPATAVAGIKPTQAINGSFVVNQQAGFTGTVSLQCGINQGISSSDCVLSPSSVTVSANPATVNVSVAAAKTASALAGQGQISISGSSASLSHSLSLPFSVTDYALAVSSQPAATVSGGSSSLGVQLQALNGYSSQVNLSCDASSLGSGASCTLSPTGPVNVTPAATTSVTATIAVPSSAQPNTYTVNVTTSDATLPTLTHRVTASLQVQGAPDLQISASPNALTVKSGSAASSTITVAPVNGLSGQVSLAVAGLPQLASASFSPASPLSVNGAALGTTLTISTTAPSVAALHLPAPNRLKTLAALWLSFSGMFGWVALAGTQRRSKLGMWLAMILTCAVLMGMIACGSGSGSSNQAPPQPKPGTPAGSYTVTVTATSGTIQQSTNITLTVQ